ncbi:hypothetical protein IJ843_03350 [bacterium]|nr:hypothetical protein [bacterium]
MKKILISGFIYLFFLASSCFADEAVYLAIEDTEPTLTQKLLQIDENEERQEPEIIEENFVPELYAQSSPEKPLEAEIEYDILYETDSIFSKYTKMHFDKGPIETIQPFFAYQGQFRFNFLDTYSTQFTEPTAELAFVGKFREQPIEYKFILNFMPNEGYSYLQSMFKDDFITFKYIPHNDITIGSFRTPIGVEGGTSGYTVPFISRSQIARNFGSVRGVGFKVTGDYSLAEYNIGMTSSDRQWKHLFPGAEFNGWLNFKPLGKTNGKYGVLKIGGGLNAGHRDFDYNVVGAYLSYKYKKFALESEYAVSHGSNGLAGLTENRAQGLYTTLSYNITKKLQVLARYDVFDNDMTKSGRRDTEYTAGINYFIKGSALKIMLNYVFCQSDYKENSNRVILGTQIIL